MAKPKLTVGDRVRFASAWLRSTCSATSPVARLQGTVQTVRNYSSCQLVTVRWDTLYFDTIETNVNAANLQRLR